MLKKNITIVLILLVCTFAVFGQKDYSTELKKELVKIEAGKFTSQDLMLLNLANGKSMQVKISATCPVDVMSRDNFISIYSTYGIILLLATFSEAGLEIPDIKELDELIGEPDLTYNFVMAKNGMQIQVVTAESKENLTMQWEEIFGK
jgi:hypothetical protein